MFGKKRIYADAAAATPLSKNAKQELLRLLDVYGNAGSLHAEAQEAKRELDAARNLIAETIGAHADEIIFTASGTEGNNLAIHGVLRPLLREGKQIHAITSVIEHSSILEPLRALAKEGLELTELPVNSAGRISVEALAAAITPHTVLISIQFINSEIGTIEPIAEITKMVRRAREKDRALPLYVHTDASQAPLWKRVDVEKLHVDLLTLDAQKVMGPKGVGALYIRRGVAIEPLLSGSKQERGLRGGTENVPLIGSFAVALADAQTHEAAASKHIANVRNTLFGEIRKRIPDVVLNGAVGDERVANNLNISIPGLDREMAVIGLDALGVAATTRSACNVADSAPSYVIDALGGSKEIVTAAIRITLLPTATKKDAHAIAVALAEVAKRYRIVA